MDKIDIALLGDCDAVVEWLDKELEKLRNNDLSGIRQDVDGKAVTEVYVGHEPVLALPARPIPIRPSSFEEAPSTSALAIPATETPHSGIASTQNSEGLQETVLSDSVENIWLFPGANTEHRWLELAREALDQVVDYDEEGDEGGEDGESSEDQDEEAEEGRDVQVEGDQQ